MPMAASGSRPPLALQSKSASLMPVLALWQWPCPCHAQWAMAMDDRPSGWSVMSVTVSHSVTVVTSHVTSHDSLFLPTHSYINVG